MDNRQNRQHGQMRPVLIVDDDNGLCEFLSMALTDQGYRTLVAGDGMEALALAAEDTPALVLLDVGMPKLSGLELAAQIGELCGAAVPCVIMSGSRPSGDELAADCVSGYLAKPFDLDDLFRLVHAYVDLPAKTATS